MMVIDGVGAALDLENPDWNLVSALILTQSLQKAPVAMPFLG